MLSAITKPYYDTLWQKHNDCSKLDKIFTPKQISFCKTNPDFMPIIKQAAGQTIIACMEQFKDFRWNCSNILNVPVLTNDMILGTFNFCIL